MVSRVEKKLYQIEPCYRILEGNKNNRLNLNPTQSSQSFQTFKRLVSAIFAFL
jgi:hypothetical protein